jgi:hypothetical protein
MSNQGAWFFDADAGANEVLFRRVGENETNTIGICQRLLPIVSSSDALVSEHPDPYLKYALTLVDADARTSVPQSVGGRPSTTPLHGYYLGRLAANAAEFIIVAYPAEYGSSGVMTFAAAHKAQFTRKTWDQKTGQRVATSKTWKRDDSWRPVDDSGLSAR